MTSALRVQPAAEEVAHLFVDFSNVWYATRSEASRRGDPDWAVRRSPNREISQPVLDRFRPRFRVELVEAGRVTGTEQGGDEMLQNAIYRTISQAKAPGTIVLATGDGAGWGEGRGFCETLRAARQRDFGVEIVSFECSLNGRLRALAQESGAMVALDSFYDSITFLEGLRPARAPGLAHRPTAVPRAWSAHEDLALMRLAGAA